MPAKKRSEFTDTTSFAPIALEAVESAVVRQGVAYWHGLRGTRPYPAYRDVHPRAIAPILGNTMLVKVLEGGADFEFRIVGEALKQSFALPFAGRRLGEMTPTSPVFGYMLKGIFGHVARTGEPAAMRGELGLELAHVNIGYFESANLPLGPSGGNVDYLLFFGAYAPRP